MSTTVHKEAAARDAAECRRIARESGFNQWFVTAILVVVTLALGFLAYAAI